MNKTFRVETQVYDKKTGNFQPSIIDIEIDLDEVGRHLAAKASKNKSGKSRIQGGMITGKIIPNAA